MDMRVVNYALCTPPFKHPSKVRNQGQVVGAVDCSIADYVVVSYLHAHLSSPTSRYDLTSRPKLATADSFQAKLESTIGIHALVTAP
jgi:hypothetical protein